MKKIMMSMGRPCVVLVERTMLQMSSGYAVTYVRNGSMANRRKKKEREEMRVTGERVRL